MSQILKGLPHAAQRMSVPVAPHDAAPSMKANPLHISRIFQRVLLFPRVRISLSLSLALSVSPSLSSSGLNSL